MGKVTMQAVEAALDAFYADCTGRPWRQFKPIRKAFAIRAMKKKLISEIIEEKSGSQKPTTKHHEGIKSEESAGKKKSVERGAQSRSPGHSHSHSRGVRSRSRSLLRSSRSSRSPPRPSVVKPSTPSSSRSPPRPSVVKPSTPSSSSSCSPLVIKSRRRSLSRRRHVITLTSSSNSSSRSPSPTHIDFAQRESWAPASAQQYRPSWDSPPKSPLLDFSGQEPAIKKRARRLRAWQAPTPKDSPSPRPVQKKPKKESLTAMVAGSPAPVIHTLHRHPHPHHPSPSPSPSLAGASKSADR